MSPDPYGQFASPYLGMGNTPQQSVDPDGGKVDPPDDYDGLFWFDGDGFFQNAVNITARNYQSIAQRGVEIKNLWRLGELQKIAPGKWIKVYDAAIIKGQEVEVHYFKHVKSGMYFQSKIKQQGWSRQFTNGLNKITNQ